jgi:hypothetical protein
VRDVDCAADDDCWAVGVAPSSLRGQSAVAEHWDGGSWKSSGLPNGPGFPSDVPTAISCPSIGSCLAVGSSSQSGNSLVTFRLSGGSWSRSNVPSPASVPIEANSLSCVDAQHCVLVGDIHPNSPGQQPVVAVMVASTWTLRVLPQAAAANQGAMLSGVSCWTSTSCEAVGSYSNDYVTHDLVADFSGGKWTEHQPHDPASVMSPQLNAVSCAGAGSCTAVGTGTVSGRAFTEAGVIDTLSGSSWTAQALSTQGLVLSDVRCTSPGACDATGYEYTNYALQTAIVAETLSGSTWSTNTILGAGAGWSPAPDVHTRPVVLACPTPTCLYAATVSGSVKPNSESFQSSGGSWHMTPMASAVTDPYDVTSGVACPTTTFCVLVGYAFSGTRQPSPYLAMRSGSSWTQNSVSIAGSAHDVLSAVACNSRISCYAIGTGKVSATSTGSSPFVTHYDGGSWSSQWLPAPHGSTAGSFVTGISCPTTDFCAVVGVANISNRWQLFVDSLNGESWSLRLLPTVTQMSLDDLWPGFASRNSQAPGSPKISCVTSANCVVVAYPAAGGHMTWLRLTGSVWIAKPLPAGRFQPYSMGSIDCVSATRCYGVGQALGAVVVDTLDGSIWTPISVPVASNWSVVFALSCARFSACTSVGYASYGDFLYRPIAISLASGHWASRTLPFVRLPSPYPMGGAVGFDYLSSVSCPTVAVCVSGGAASTGPNSLATIYGTS